MYVYIYVEAVFTFVMLYSFICIYSHVHANLYSYAYGHIHTDARNYVHTCICVGTYDYVYVCMYCQIVKFTSMCLYYMDHVYMCSVHFTTCQSLSATYCLFFTALKILEVLLF